MNTKIEFASIDDAKDILNIYAPYITNTPITFEYDVPSITEFENRMQKVTNFYPWLVYKINDEIVGYAYASLFRERAAFQWDSEISIYLNPDHQGIGIAKKLYPCLLELLTLQGFYNVYALITIPNEKSIGLHKLFGFEHVGTYQNTGYKFDQWYSLETLVKHLRPKDIVPHKPISIQNINKKTIDEVLGKYLI